MTSTRVCTKCGQEKPEWDFGKYPKGHTSRQCKACVSTRMRESRRMKQALTLSLQAHPETVENMLLVGDWCTSDSIAEKRGVTKGTVYKGLLRLMRRGVVERRRTGVPTKAKGGMRFYYEYKRTALGSRWVAEKARRPEDETQPERVVVPPPNLTNPFQWRTYVQPFQPEKEKWAQPPRPNQVVSTRFTQYT
jgi:predicted transcriptional regulator